MPDLQKKSTNHMSRMSLACLPLTRFNEARVLGSWTRSAFSRFMRIHWRHFLLIRLVCSRREDAVSLIRKLCFVKPISSGQVPAVDYSRAMASSKIDDCTVVRPVWGRDRPGRRAETRGKASGGNWANILSCDWTPDWRAADVPLQVVTLTNHRMSSSDERGGEEARRDEDIDATKRGKRKWRFIQSSSDGNGHSFGDIEDCCADAQKPLSKPMKQGNILELSRPQNRRGK
ncbi:hypothetical protein DL98DRAFT_533903 [Cadophora sp. DSE1049]|nr:hypothetical protein DL98DRAFT_533903 [Cadophora sp. DSE1049]